MVSLTFTTPIFSFFVFLVLFRLGIFPDAGSIGGNDNIRSDPEAGCVGSMLYFSTRTTFGCVCNSSEVWPWLPLHSPQTLRAKVSLSRVALCSYS